MEEINRLKTELETAFSTRNVDKAVAVLKEIHSKKVKMSLTYHPEFQRLRTEQLAEHSRHS